ncbi:hypothetical protein [Roseateles sp. LYH14W]|uniref:Uncharacterized protein n=1 Tax=Pelomonas parva TaxID=3299032 RepID=A0ABW7F9I2_9BURK
MKVSNVQPQRLEIQGVEADKPSDGAVLSADVTGDLSRLAGQTVYVLVEDGTQTFEVVSTEIRANGIGNQITLRAKSTLGRSGTIEGILNVHVCLDLACKSPLGNSPVSVPYKLTLAPAIKIVEASPIQVEVPFGTIGYQDAFVAYAVRRPVTLRVPPDFVGGIPNYGTEWTASTGRAPAVLATLSHGALPAGESVPAEMMFGLAPVGTYSSKLKLSSWSGNRSAESVVTVNYVVKESGQRMLYVPSTISAQTGSTGRGTDASAVTVVAADGAQYTRVGRIVYSANSRSVKWLYLTSVSGGAAALNTTRFFSSVSNCGGEFLLVNCLPAGNYTAMVYLATEAGDEAPVPLPVSMQVLNF